LFVAALAACIFYFTAEAVVLSGDFGFPLDDSWIHLQFARNLATGHGLSYNPGEIVTGSTAPLWTALLALISFLPGNIILWTKLFGSVFYLLSIDVTWRLGRELGLTRRAASFAAALTLGTSWLVWSALSGMEIPLFVFLSLWGILLHLRERRAKAGPPLSLGVLALACLARPEGLLLLLFAVVDRCLCWQEAPVPEAEDGASSLSLEKPLLPPLAEGLLLTACALAAPLLFYRISGGSFLPTTFSAKAAPVRHALPSLPYLYNILAIFFRPQPFATLLLGAGVSRQIRNLGTDKDRGLLLSFWVIGLPLAYSMITHEGAPLAGNFGRYYFPLFPVLVLLAVLGMEPAARRLGATISVGGQRLWIGALLTVLIAAPTAYNLIEGAGLYSINVVNVQSSDIRAARWLAPRLDQRALLAVNDIGAFKYLLPNRVVDLAGIANPEILREVGASMRHGKPLGVAMLEAIAARRPDYIIVFPAWLPAVDQSPLFERVYDLHIENNRTMGASELVVYRTPWTRFPLHEPAPGASRKPRG
jgi:hypothetical protein